MTDFIGTAGNDIFTGGSGADTAAGGGGNDTLSGGGGNDIIAGGLGSDVLNGGDDWDLIYTFDISPPYARPYYGNIWTAPLLDTGTERDTVVGGAGDDRIFAGYGDNINGGDGTDGLVISFMGATSGVAVDFSQLVSGGSISVGGGTIQSIEYVEWVEGSDFGDNIIMGDDSANFAPVFGKGGNDHIIGGYYTGDMHGGDGDDILDRGSSPYGFQHFGEGGNDLLIGSYNGETLDGGEGDDELLGNGGYDTLVGGAGNDIMDGGSYGDHLSGGSGNDAMYGGGDADTIDGQAGDDSIYGDFSPLGSGNALSPSSNDDVIFGGAGADVIYGDQGDDQIWSGSRDGEWGIAGLDDAGTEHDQLFGGDGDDKLNIGLGDDADGGSGSDTLNISMAGAPSGVIFDTRGFTLNGTWSLAGSLIKNVEAIGKVTGSAFGDTFTVGTHAFGIAINASAGNDLIISHNSSVEAMGGEGDDRFVSGAAGDYFDGGAGIDTVDYQKALGGVAVTLADDLGTGTGAGGDQLTDVENIYGSAFGDSLTGNSDSNLLRGMVGNDSLYGGGGNDRLEGGTGTDLLYGGHGNDLYIVTDADDVIEEEAEGVDTVQASLDHTLRNNVENLILTGSAAINGTGNELANLITGNGAANILQGAGGADRLIGGGGNDQIDGGDGGDIFIFDAGSQHAVAEIADSGANGIDEVRFVATSLSTLTLFAGDTGIERVAIGTGTGDVANATGTTSLNVNAAQVGNALTMVGNAGANLLTGTAFGDTLLGAGGVDRLIGADGDDILDGGAGADKLIGGLGNDIYYVDSAADYILEDLGEGADTVYSSVTLTLRANVEHLFLEGSAAINGNGNDLDNTVAGNEAANVLTGRLGDDFLVGFNGADTLEGGEGNDSLAGGYGRDRMYGEAGSDAFIFNDGDFAGMTSATCDQIRDFSQLDGDIIRLETVDANTGLAGNQAFTFIGDGAFTGIAGELRYQQKSGNTYVQGDTNGDGLADFWIRLDGLHTLTSGDYVL